MSIIGKYDVLLSGGTDTHYKCDVLIKLNINIVWQYPWMMDRTTITPICLWFEGFYDTKVIINYIYPMLIAYSRLRSNFSISTAHGISFVLLDYVLFVSIVLQWIHVIRLLYGPRIHRLHWNHRITARMKNSRIAGNFQSIKGCGAKNSCFSASGFSMCTMKPAFCNCRFTQAF